jgi:homeobox-leucine zipper protein
LRSGDDSTQCWKSVLSIAFQFAYEPHSEEAVAAVARQYVRSVVGSVQRVAMALAPTCIKMPAPSPRSPPGSPDALLLAKRVASSYRLHVGIELTDSKDPSPEGIFKAFWMHPHAIVCWVVKASPEYTFANKAGLEILGTSIHELASVDWNKSMDDEGRKLVYAASSQVLQQGYAYLPPGVTISCKGQSVGYEKALMWKVLDDMGNMQCVAVCYQNWSVLHYQ